MDLLSLAHVHQHLGGIFQEGLPQVAEAGNGATIDDPVILDEITVALEGIGLAKSRKE